MVKRKYQKVKWMKGGKRSLIYEDDEGKKWWFGQSDEDGVFEVIEEIFCWEFLRISSL